MKTIVDFLIEAFMWIAAIGLSCILLCFVLLWTGREDLSGAISAVLFPGLFVVWIPTVIVAGRLTQGARRSDFWKIALRGCPQWMRTALYIAIGFGVANFLYFVVLGGNRKDIPMILFGGGHMLIFYGVAFGVLYSAHNKPELMETPKCPNGHEISPTDSFCSRCGATVIPIVTFS